MEKRCVYVIGGNTVASAFHVLPMSLEMLIGSCRFTLPPRPNAISRPSFSSTMAAWMPLILPPVSSTSCPHLCQPNRRTLPRIRAEDPVASCSTSSVAGTPCCAYRNPAQHSAAHRPRIPAVLRLAQHNLQRLVVMRQRRAVQVVHRLVPIERESRAMVIMVRRVVEREILSAFDRLWIGAIKPIELRRVFLCRASEEAKPFQRDHCAESLA